MESIKIRCQTRHKKYQPSDKLLPWKRRPGARGSKHSFFLGKSTWTNWRAQPNRALYVLYFQTACAYVRGCWAPYVWDQAVSGMSTMSKPACTAVFGGESSCDVGKKNLSIRDAAGCQAVGWRRSWPPMPLILAASCSEWEVAAAGSLLQSVAVTQTQQASTVSDMVCLEADDDSGHGRSRSAAAS
jgi:hypothetical protein